ncbi:MAG TPA: hypothetical protein VMV92_10445 [Streptosporangiaceae bacterium]|nr:hypothetical protein [Streptosporangiaceae bacterium]
MGSESDDARDEAERQETFRLAWKLRVLRLLWAVPVVIGVVLLVVALVVGGMLTNSGASGPGNPAGRSSAAVLGATQGAFIAALGQPDANSQTDLLNFKPCGHFDQFIVGFIDGHAMTIEWQPCPGQSLSTSALESVARAYFPAGAGGGSGFTTENGEPARQYLSAALAPAFAASWFHDCAGNADPPGTFSLVFTTDQGWFLGTGTCP